MGGQLGRVARPADVGRRAARDADLQQPDAGAGGAPERGRAAAAAAADQRVCARPLAIGAARVALIDADGAILPGSERAVRFSGGGTATLSPGAPLVSDPVALPTKALARLSISLFLPGDTGGCTCHMSGSELVQVSSPGDFTEKPLPRRRGQPSTAPSSPA